MPDPAVWGDVATWFTGVLTGGSLLLGFSILRNDRKKEERAQAEKVVAWVAQWHDPTNPAKTGFRITVWNTSERPILNIRIFERQPENEPPRQRLAAVRRIAQRLRHVDPFDPFTSHIDVLYGTYFTEGKHPEELFAGEKFDCIVSAEGQSAMFLLFVDSSGRHWVRNIESTELHSLGRSSHGLLNPYTVVWDLSSVKFSDTPEVLGRASSDEALSDE